MATLTWQGSGMYVAEPAKASDPTNWNPNGVPQAGDTLVMSSNTHEMLVSGNDLAGDTLTVTNPVPTPPAQSGEQVALSDGATATIDAKQNVESLAVRATGSDTLSLTADQGADGQLDIQLLNGATLNATIKVQQSHINVESGPGGSLVNDGASYIIGANGPTPNLIEPDVTGTGSWTLSNYSSGGTTVEFGGAVSSGQSFILDGDPDRGPNGAGGTLVIDHPQEFQGSVTLNPGGGISLRGIDGVTGYTYDGSTLDLFVGSTQVESMSLTKGPPPGGTSPPTDLYVYNEGDGAVITYGHQQPGNVPQLSGPPTPPPPPPPPPDEDTYQYLPPGGTLGPVTPITNHTLAGGPGAYSVHGTGLQFIASAFDEVGFTQGSNFDLTIQAGGGVAEEGGSWNLAIANSGAFAAIDANPANGHNMFVVASPVVAALAEMEPTDNMFLQGVQQSDIDQAFASLAANPQQGAAVLSIPRAGGSALALVLPNQASAPLLASQFHAFG